MIVSWVEMFPRVERVKCEVCGHYYLNYQKAEHLKFSLHRAAVARRVKKEALEALDRSHQEHAREVQALCARFFCLDNPEWQSRWKVIEEPRTRVRRRSAWP